MCDSTIWRMDQGLVAGAEYHDSTIVEFGLSETKTFSIKYKTLTNKYCVMELRTVREMNLSNIRINEIITTIFAWRTRNAPVSLDICDSAWLTLFSSVAKNENLMNAINKCVSDGPNDILVEIGTAYSNSIVVVCSDISFAGMWQSPQTIGGL